MKYELWESTDADGEVSGHTFLASGQNDKALRVSREMAEEDGGAISLVWTCDAASWTEACTLMHEHLGFEPYRPMEWGRIRLLRWRKRLKRKTLARLIQHHNIGYTEEAAFALASLLHEGEEVEVRVADHLTRMSERLTELGVPHEVTHVGEHP